MNIFKDAWNILWDIMGWFQIITFIDQFDEGVLLRRGKFSRVVKPGIAWHWPLLIDDITVMNVRTTALELAEQSLTTLDDVKIVVRGVLMWNIFDIKKAILDVEDVEETLADIAVGYIQEMVEETEWQNIRTREFRNDLKKHIQKQARKWGITVSTVKFQDLTMAHSIRLFGGIQ